MPQGALPGIKQYGLRFFICCRAAGLIKFFFIYGTVITSIASNWRNGDGIYNMKCNECRDWLNQHIDDELNPEQSARVTEHLESCPECREEYTALLAAKQAVGKLPEYLPPPEFTQAWKAAIAQEATGKAAPGKNWWRAGWFKAVAGIGVAAAALVLVFTTGPYAKEFQRAEQRINPTPAPTMDEVASAIQETDNVEVPVSPPPVDIHGESGISSTMPGSEETEPEVALTPRTTQPAGTEPEPQPSVAPDTAGQNEPVATPAPQPTQQPDESQIHDGEIQGGKDEGKTVTVNVDRPVNEVADILRANVPATPIGNTIQVKVSEANIGAINSAISQLGGSQSAQINDTVVFVCKEADVSLHLPFSFLSI